VGVRVPPFAPNSLRSFSAHRRIQPTALGALRLGFYGRVPPFAPVIYSDFEGSDAAYGFDGGGAGVFPAGCAAGVFGVSTGCWVRFDVGFAGPDWAGADCAGADWAGAD
jgi:hypothetical protein